MKKRVRLVFGLALTLSLLGVAGCGDDDDDDGTDTGTEATVVAARARSGCCSPTPRPPSGGRTTTAGTSQQFFEDAGLVEGEDFTIVNAEGDAQTQQSQAEQAIADDASVILLTSLDTGSGATIIDTAKDAGVEVVEYDRFNTGGSGGAAYVSFDNVQVGATMAEVLEPDHRRARRSTARGS